MLWSVGAYYTVPMHFYFQGQQIDNRSTHHVPSGEPMAEKCEDVLFESRVFAVKSEVE